MKKTPEEIIATLHSITKVAVFDDDLDVCFDGKDELFSSREFLPGSFTRELFELIHNHMMDSE
jgi:hypothetical protein